MSRTVTDRLEASRQSSPEAPVRRSQLVLLTSIAILGAACGGEDQSSPRTSRAVESTQQLATLEGLLPGELGSVRLRREAFTGSAWLRASPEEAFSPEVSVDISRFLERLRKPSSDLTVAWAIAQSGPKVVAYQVRGATAQALVDAYVGAIRERLSRGTLGSPDVCCGERRSPSPLTASRQAGDTCMRTTEFSLRRGPITSVRASSPSSSRAFRETTRPRRRGASRRSQLPA
jgi:hypothetical protein